MYFARRDEVPQYSAFHTFLNACRGIPGLFLALWLLKSIGSADFHIIYLVLAGMMFSSTVLMYLLYRSEKKKRVSCNIATRA